MGFNPAPLVGSSLQTLEIRKPHRGEGSGVRIKNDSEEITPSARTNAVDLL
jgi:hypothetical protein